MVFLWALLAIARPTITMLEEEAMGNIIASYSFSLTYPVAVVVDND